MDVLLDSEELEIQQAVRDFLAAECTPAVVRAAEKDPTRVARELWQRFTALGWLGLSLPVEHGGQGLPLTYLGILYEELGRHMAPLPVHSTLVPALVVARYASPQLQDRILAQVSAGDIRLCFAIQEESAHWGTKHIDTVARREGMDFVLSGTKFFVDGFANAQLCLALARLEGGPPALFLVDTDAKGVASEPVVSMSRDDQCTVHFNQVRIPAANMVSQERRAIEDLMDYAAVSYACMMQGAARRAMELAVRYVNEREAFGQPIGAFQAIQHMAADMVNAVDGTQLLAREAVWRLSQDLPARVEVAQAKSWGNEKCLATCRMAQQMHGGIGFIAEFDINLWYRRVAAWSLRGGTTREHRRLISGALLGSAGRVRLGMRQEEPAEE